MGIAVIAEGVETAQQRDILLAESCEEMQGYFFSTPKPVAELPLFLMQFGSQQRAEAAAEIAKAVAAGATGN
jgi:EAL domain-containing protein (putative c-di-GMP-specific phosphodiesterase class I)